MSHDWWTAAEITRVFGWSSGAIWERARRQHWRRKYQKTRTGRRVLYHLDDVRASNR